MLELVIGESAAGSARWLQDGTPLGSEFTLDGASLRVLDEVRIAYQNLFTSHSRPFAKPEEIKALGAVLYESFFRPAESALSSLAAAGPHTLLLRSHDPDFFNLPWELIYLPGSNLPLGCDPSWAVLRVSGSLSGNTLPRPDPGPLRLLFLAAAPEGDVPLDYEREEEAMLEATSHLAPNVVVLPFAETGGLDELADLVRRHRPHVVHLSGHGTVDPNGIAWFAFEDERGRSSLQPADEIANRVFRGSAVRCVVLNACQSGQAAAVGLAGRLVSAGIPAVIGWGAPVIDEMATRFAGKFYRFLAAGDRLAMAVARAREDIWRSCRRTVGQHESWDATFALPRLFVSTLELDLINCAAPPSKHEGPRTEMILLGDEIKGLKEGFVGRRREQQQLIPSLRDGICTVAVLTGIGGMGKSTLATRAASRLREAGFEVTGIKVNRASTPTEAGRLFLVEKLLPALARPFMVTEPAVYTAVRNGEFPVEDRVELAVAEWKKRKLALVIDNFEDVLDTESRAIADPGLQRAYRILTRNLTGGSRLIVTCRYLPADTPDPVEATHVFWRDLKDLKLFEVVKFLRRDDSVEARIRSGQISRQTIERIHHMFGGTPGFLVQVRGLLGTADLDEWDEETLEDTPLEEARQRYCERILLPKLYSLLPPGSQALASRLAVSELPLPADGLAQVASIPECEATAYVAAAASYGLVQVFAEEGKPTLYHVPGLIRGWLSAGVRLSVDDRRLVDGACTLFWKKSYESDREDELQVAIDVELLACRTHAQRAGLTMEFRWASVALSYRLIQRAEWVTARDVLSEIPEPEEDGGVWHQLATIDGYEGNYAEAREKFGKSLAIEQVIGNRAGEAVTWHQLATIDLDEGKYTEAREKFGKSLTMRQAIGDKAGEAASWHQLATIDMNEGKYAEAREKFGNSLAMLQAIGYRAGEAASWHQLASIDVNQGKYAEAREKFGNSLAIKQAISNKAGEAATWHQLATIDVNEGKYLEAREKFGRSLAIKQANGDRAGEAATWQQLASIDVNQGKYAEAREKFGNSLAMFQAIGDRAGEAATWHGLASLDGYEGKYAEAREKFGNSLAIKQAIGDKVGEAASWHQLATIDMNEGKYAEAREKFGNSLAMLQAIGYRAGEAASWHQLASIDVNQGKYAEAREKFGNSLAIKQAIGDRASEAATWHQLATIDANEGKYAEAREKFGKSLGINQSIGNRAGEAATWHNLASIDVKEGRYAEAREKSDKALAMLEAIGDRAGEAATWHSLASIDAKEHKYADALEKLRISLATRQAIGDRAGEAATWRHLGFAAWEIGKQSEAVQSIATSFLLFKSIGHGDYQQAAANLTAKCGELGYTKDQIVGMLNSVAVSYHQDRGSSLLKAVFAE